MITELKINENCFAVGVSSKKLNNCFVYYISFDLKFGRIVKIEIQMLLSLFVLFIKLILKGYIFMTGVRNRKDFITKEKVGKKKNFKSCNP